MTPERQINWDRLKTRVLSLGFFGMGEKTSRGLPTLKERQPLSMVESSRRRAGISWPGQCRDHTLRSALSLPRQPRCSSDRASRNSDNRLDFTTV
jgi:hypothetical protein